VTGECDPAFELAVDAVVFGRMEELDRLLADTPDLIRRRSAFGQVERSSSRGRCG